MHYTKYMLKFNRALILIIILFLFGQVNVVHASEGELANKLQGYILLQVQSVGEAWYLNPVDKKRYYMRDGKAAYNIMRYFGLGATNIDIAKLLKNDQVLINRLRGRIVLQVESHGEAYYVHPTNGAVYYLKNGEVAYELMRELSLGITNQDLNKIDIGIANFLTATKNEDSPVVKKVIQEIEKTFINSAQAEEVEVHELAQEEVSLDVTNSDLDLSHVNNYWLSLINGLRVENGLSELVIDSRWVDTATKWADYMNEIELATHSRADGSSMHDWINSQGLDFGVRGSEKGWNKNYFTENVAWNVVSHNHAEDILQALKETFTWMVNEKSYNGIHYRTIIHPDWNSLGVGVHVSELDNGHYQAYIAIHYGNLQL